MDTAPDGHLALRYVQAQRYDVVLCDLRMPGLDGPAFYARLCAQYPALRQRVLFLEGYRAFDIERLNLPLVPAVGSPYLQGGVYGGTVCFPVPDIEKNNNPNIVAAEIITGVRGEVTPP